jgi:hypothetical protein
MYDYHMPFIKYPDYLLLSSAVLSSDRGNPAGGRIRTEKWAQRGRPSFCTSGKCENQSFWTGMNRPPLQSMYGLSTQDSDNVGIVEVDPVMAELRVRVVHLGVEAMVDRAAGFYRAFESTNDC